MDARVNDFLNEINQISPLDENKDEPLWEKCYDEDSGYHYYWNTKTNEVTWDMPPDYKPTKSKSKKSNNLYIPPRTAPLFPSASNLSVDSADIKIYKIGECTSITNQRDYEKTVECTKPVRRKSQSEDEKVVLISQYGDSESDDENQSAEDLVNGSKRLKSPISHDDDSSTADIVTKAQKPPEVTTIEPKASTGFSLVLGYSDSEDESEAELSTPEKVSHSTLFPVTKPIDVRDFEQTNETSKQDEDFDSKAFQRKRRIGVALVNTGKKCKNDEEGERKGLGFSDETDAKDSTQPSYPGFSSGGVLFVKADVLNTQPNEDDVEIDDTYTTLKEKLGFLSEGREQVSPVQVMLIQIQTLYEALKSGDLKQSYLRKWLDDTSSDLIKLEKETAPEGWLLQWDRSHKRYYYQNAQTGESQWEYPQADVTVCDEAMDICTTPPPNGAESTIHVSPPLPPTIASPSPPPPPVISQTKTKRKETVSEVRDAEPLPPGVDAIDATAKTKDVGNDLNDVLNSFYSDIAAIETTATPVSTVEDTKVDVDAETSKKKKKKSKTDAGNRNEEEGSLQTCREMEKCSIVVK